MSDIVLTKKTYSTIEDGVYPAHITGIEETTGTFGPQLKIKFQLEDEDLNDVLLTGWTSANYSEKSKLFGWTKAILGSAFDPGADFRSSLIIGKHILLNVSKKLSTDGQEYNKVEDVLPVLRRSPRKPEAQLMAELGFDVAPVSPEPPVPDAWPE